MKNAGRKVFGLDARNFIKEFTIVFLMNIKTATKNKK